MITEKILKECVNYDAIVNYNYSSKDYITDAIINNYQNYIFKEDNKNMKKLLKLDKIIFEYITDIDFHEYVKNYYLSDNIKCFDDDNFKLIELYDKYNLLLNDFTYFNKWI